MLCQCPTSECRLLQNYFNAILVAWVPGHAGGRSKLHSRFNSSGVVSLSAFGAVNPKSGHSNDFEIGIHSFFA